MVKLLQDSGLDGCVDAFLNIEKSLLHLVKLWCNTNQLVSADYYFSSVSAAELMVINGLKFVGVIKTATRESTMECLSCIELDIRGGTSCFVRRNTQDPDKCDLLDYFFMYRDRRYFIVYGYSMSEFFLYHMVKTRQDNQENNHIQKRLIYL